MKPSIPAPAPMINMRTCLAFSIFFALVTTGVQHPEETRTHKGDNEWYRHHGQLSCEVCIAAGEVCHGKMQPCFLGEDTCASILGETTLGMVEFAGALKACTGHRACKAGIRTMTIGPGITLRRSAVCCKRESCRKQLAKLPPVNTTRNGFICPACFAKNSHSCEAEWSMHCTGSENHCVHITGILESVDVAVNTRFAARGCAVPSVCEHSKGMAVFSGVYTYTLSTVRECYKAPSGKNAACFHHQRS